MCVVKDVIFEAQFLKLNIVLCDWVCLGGNKCYKVDHISCVSDLHLVALWKVDRSVWK